MTDFALYHVGDWRNGEAPKLRTATYVVNYDQRNRAYQIDRDQYDDFIQWVAEKWELENEPHDTDAGETCADYLDRIGVSIREL